MPDLSRWRWADRSFQSVSVIEPATKFERPEGAHTVPFGFARALAPEPSRAVEAEPMVWEGDDA